MNAQWKKNQNLDPNVILLKLDSIKTVTPDNKIFYVGDEYHECMISLQSMISFKEKFEILNKDTILSKAISNIAIQGDLNKDSVIKEINNIIKQELSTKEIKYHILTTISLRKPYPFKTLELENCKIRIIDDFFPKKYLSRNNTIQKYEKERIQDGYAKVIISLKARSPRTAMTNAISLLDLQRSILCLLANYSSELMGDNWKPINRVRLGKYHTIHKDNGKILDDLIWYEPNYVHSMLCFNQNNNIFIKNYQFIQSKIESCDYKDVIKEALLRFVRALDERDQNVAIIKLWGALETLIKSDYNNSDAIVRRCSFLFYPENKYHKQMLEHIREYRNANVHAGDSNDHSKKICFQLQFYFRNLIFFHIHNYYKFSSLDEANSFLDLSTDKSKLEIEKLKIERAIEFLSPNLHKPETQQS